MRFAGFFRVFVRAKTAGEAIAQTRKRIAIFLMKHSQEIQQNQTDYDICSRRFRAAAALK
jgi:hypothetical protein